MQMSKGDQNEGNGGRSGGYRVPPVEHQFVRGKSGNPNGRRGNKAPGGLSGYHDLVLRAGDRLVTTADGKKASLIQRAVERDAFLAANGDEKANGRIRSEYREASAMKAAHDAFIYHECFNFYFIVQERFEYTEREGLPPPDFVPHPYHVHITPEEVWFTGPHTREGRAEWEYIKDRMRFASRAVAFFRKLLKTDPDPQNELCLRKARAMLERWRRLIPAGWDWKEQIYTLDSSPEDLKAFEQRLCAKAKRLRSSLS
jgi:hypothetical protein